MILQGVVDRLPGFKKISIPFCISSRPTNKAPSRGRLSNTGGLAVQFGLTTIFSSGNPPRVNFCLAQFVRVMKRSTLRVQVESPFVELDHRADGERSNSGIAVNRFRNGPPGGVADAPFSELFLGIEERRGTRDSVVMQGEHGRHAGIPASVQNEGARPREEIVDVNHIRPRISAIFSPARAGPRDCKSPGARWRSCAALRRCRHC